MNWNGTVGLARATVVVWIAWIGAALGASSIPDLRKLPAAYQSKAVSLPDGDSFGRVRLEATAAQPAYLAVGDPAGACHRVLIAPDRVAVQPAGAQRAELLSVRPTDAACTIEFSRHAREFNLYLGRRRVWRADLAAGPAPLSAYAAQAEVKLPFHALGPVLMSDDFMRSNLEDGQIWKVASGSWRMQWDAATEGSPNLFRCTGKGKGPGLLLTGYPFWNNLTLAGSVLPQDGEIGLFFGYRDAGDYFKAVMRRQPAEALLVQVAGGEERILARRAILYPAGRWVRLAVRIHENQPVEFSVDGVDLLAGPADLNTFGKVGFLVTDGEGACDDFLAASAPEAPGALRPLAKISKVFSAKRRYMNDDRDLHLDRWAKDADAWQPYQITHENRPCKGLLHELPVFGNFEADLTHTPAGALVVLADMAGTPLHVISVPATKGILARRGDGIDLDGKEVFHLSGATGLRVGLVAPAAAVSRESAPVVRTANVVQEVFEEAPVHWLPAGGEWENTQRWTCARQWSFYGGVGVHDVVQFSKRRFIGNQVHEFYFGMKDVFSRQVNNDRYARHDVNFSFCCDGKDLFSGYTFLYGGYDNKASYLLRGRKVVALNEQVRFNRLEESPNGIYDLHLFWMKFRFERVGGRLRVLLDEQVVFDYTDPDPLPAGGQIALWTVRNGVVYARLNSSAEEIENAAGAYLLAPSAPEGLPWLALNPDRVLVRPGPDGGVEVVNRMAGGTFAVRHPLPAPVDLAVTPRLRLRLDIPAGVKVGLHVCVSGRLFLVPLTGPVESTYHLLGGASEPDLSWWAFGGPALKEPEIAGAPAAEVHGVREINLLDEARARFPGLPAYNLQALVIGNTSHHDYLIAGLSGNTAGAVYGVGAPGFVK